MMKASRISYGFLIAFILTIALGYFVTATNEILIGIGFVATMCFFSLFVAKKKNTLALLLSVLIGIMLATVVVKTSAHVTTNGDIEYYANGNSVTVHGKIVDAADIRPTVTKYTVMAEQLVDGEENAIPVSGKILVSDMGGWPQYRYGERITITGTLARPEPIEDFAYDKYLSVQGIYALMPRAKIELADTGDIAAPTMSDQFFRGLFAVRSRFESSINRILPEPHASLLAGLLTGSRRGIPEKLTDDFRMAGITHIIAISGYNVTIILTLLSGFLFWIPLKKRFPFLIAAIILFAIFVGGSASVVRASIMGILGLLALQTGRQTTARLSILWTAFFMLCWNPLSLWYDASFQLSFLAVIGITELSAPLKKFLRFVPDTLALRESLTATIAAQIATLPLTIILFKQISLIAPITNLLVAPIIPLAMLLGFIATIVGLLWLPLGLLVSYLCFALLHAIIWIANISAHLPLAVISL